MSTTTFEENWKPISIDEQTQLEETEGKYFINKSSSNIKPSKLARYSFAPEQLINYEALGVQLGYYQDYINPSEDSHYNLTDYIPVAFGITYLIKADEGVVEGVKYITFFNEKKEYGSCIEFSYGIDESIEIPSSAIYVRLSIKVDAWHKIVFKRSGVIAFNSLNKGLKISNIVNNIKGENFYRDLKLEVFVKEEAIIKDFVYNFNLNDFLNFPYLSSNLNIYTKTQPYYLENYNANDWAGSTFYFQGDVVKYVDGYSPLALYICLYNHTSENSWYDIVGSTSIYEWQCWTKLEDEKALYISKSIKESNYQSSIGYPYLTEIVFKNIWGCDMLNSLNTYVKSMALAISYNNFFAKNLRRNHSRYTKYYEQGYFEGGNSADPYLVDGFGVRLIFGESFEEDELLGKNKLNNYFNVVERGHAIPSNWNGTDNVVQNILGLSNADPFDHYYTYGPKIGMPFFKEKSFSDSSIRLVLEKFDVLGNIYKRIINLPVLLTFTNNLIKVYFRQAGSGGYIAQYINSNVEHSYEVNFSNDNTECNALATVWCPNSERLTLSSTLIGSAEITQRPEIINKNGQTCQINWKFKRGSMAVHDIMRAVHILEYSDGSNYDKFIYIENIERSA